jgi:hypothetical protein
MPPRISPESSEATHYPAGPTTPWRRLRRLLPTKSASLLEAAVRLCGRLHVACKSVPPEVEKFFDAVEAGQWEEIKAQWDALAPHSGQYEYSTNHWEELAPFWPAVLDAYGVAEQAHLWPAQKLLDYGNAILDSLQPGMVYVGGTDNGRWVPELLYLNC